MGPGTSRLTSLAGQVVGGKGTDAELTGHATGLCVQTVWTAYQFTLCLQCNPGLDSISPNC